MRTTTALLLLFATACGEGPVGGGEADATVLSDATVAPDATVSPDADLGPWRAIVPPTDGPPTIVWVWVHGASLFVNAGDWTIYRTTDEGTTWQPLPYSHLAMSNDGMTLYGLAPFDGVDGLSTNGGATWTDHQTILEVDAVSVDPDLVYGFIPRLDPEKGWYRDPYVSENAGVDTAPITASHPPFSFYTDPVVGDRVYATSAKVFLRSDNRGAAWTTVSFAAGQVRIDPGAAGTLWRFEGTSLAHSDDAGDSWIPIVGAPADVRELLAVGDGTALAFTVDRQIWRVTVAGEWSLAGSTPVDVRQAFLGATPETLVIVPADFADRVYITHTSGAD